jgi:TPR repeat protein
MRHKPSSGSPKLLYVVYERAAESGYAPAQGRLAQLYEKGQGVPLDYVVAYSWYVRAVSGGHEASKQAMAWLSKRMTSKQLRAAQIGFLNRANREQDEKGQDAVIVEKKLPAQQWSQK